MLPVFLYEKNGINTIVVNANTNCGSDSKTIKVTYNQIIKPLVTVYLPTLDSTNTVATQIKTGGIVELVTDRTKFSIKVNGVNYTGFTFVSKGTNKFEFAGLLGLNPGLNIITFTGTHSSGGIHVVTKKVVLPSTQLLTPNNNPIPNKGNKNKQTPNNGSLKVR